MGISRGHFKPPEIIEISLSSIALYLEDHKMFCGVLRLALCVAEKFRLKLCFNFSNWMRI